MEWALLAIGWLCCGGLGLGLAMAADRINTRKGGRTIFEAADIPKFFALGPIVLAVFFAAAAVHKLNARGAK